jgi:hypothetical protein
MTEMTAATAATVLTQSTEPLIGILLVATAEAEIKFEITEYLAHKICTDLERFLTGDCSPASAGTTR